MPPRRSTSQKETPPRSKSNANSRSSTRSGGSTSSRRSATKVKSFRESPLSDDDQEDSDDQDDDGSDFGEDAAESLEGEEADDDDESEQDHDEEEEDDDGSESDEHVKFKGKSSQKRKSTSKSNDEKSNGVAKKLKTTDDEYDEDGRIVTELISAPKTGHVPAGQISPHLMDFLSKLLIPSNNDREWFAKHDSIFRYGWENWNKFVEVLISDLIEKSDETLPFLPSKDCVYRIYRDVRFSNDKTPYKTRMSATFSRGGRKSENYGGYHLVVGPNHQSALYGGWHDPKNVVRDKIRRSIIDNDDDGKKLKEIVSQEEFVEMFGEPRSSNGKGKSKGKSNEGRQNLWGASDELKNAPKMEGVDKNHPEIEWLKLKSYWVQKKFTDEEVLSPNFRDLVCEAAKVMAPLVEHLNDFIHPPPPEPNA